MHYVLHFGDIETAGCDVGCYQDCFGRGLEAFEGLETLFLDSLGVEGVGFEVQGCKEWDEAADGVDGIYEDQCATGISQEEVIQKQILILGSGWELIGIGS